MKEKIAKLIDLKSIVTVAMTGAMIALLFCDIEPQKEILTLFCTSYGATVTYYFTHKSEK